MPELAARIRTEREALIALLETLTPEQWQTPSLCEAWRVIDVAAHVAWAPPLGLREAIPLLARAGFDSNRMTAATALEWSGRGTSAILEQLRANAEADAKPILVPRLAALDDAVVHQLDIRVPLGATRVIPAGAVAQAADFAARLRWPLSQAIKGSTQRRIAGLQLVAEPSGWTYDEGDLVRGDDVTILLMLHGRPFDHTRLSGAGVATLLRRR
ncbi:maleylpyruvate isomerase family mycothiol-dependent enzyme [Janibacter sp. G1551]|uniref:maleylpyruvate isomerase family mycothiol-dependent enzyme n=1 Tax=Janibacter sp. G1551 TaxID=3420440 RepID=UPI003D0042EC